MTERTYSTRRQAIANALKNKLLEINGRGSYVSRIAEAYTQLKFYDDIHNFPAIFVIPGTETRTYQAANYRDRYLDLRIMLFVKEENPLEACEGLLEDIETVIETNGTLVYEDRTGTTQTTHDITVLTISTDEGTLDPISIGEITVRVHY
jgi:hypothetical protein